MSRFILAIFFVSDQVSTPSSGLQALERLRAKVSIKSVADASIERLAGHYATRRKNSESALADFFLVMTSIYFQMGPISFANGATFPRLRYPIRALGHSRRIRSN
jgi:hypothetical protein